MQSLGPGKRGVAPVESWNPPFCGDIDMRIAADGAWFYMGTPIGRPALVRLFASVLKREDGRYFLVTPVEKIGIVVDDAPFQAVEMGVDGAGDRRVLSFRTNVDDIVTVASEHALRFERDAHDGVRPYVHVRRDLWARLTRAVTHELLAMGEVRTDGGREMFGVMAGGNFHPIMQASLIEGLT
ncbi:MAG: DUF1285 domain-containing protein [Hyphomicrobiales bacterium]|nr:DUF1285 domain-containing protein [Hyphomicrobiales bacterium]